MDRMKAAGLFLVVFLGVSSRAIAADGTYMPEYAASPAATSAQPEITCTLRTTLPTDTRAPMQITLEATGMMEGKGLSVFRYLFGDGESATGSGRVQHTYVQAGEYQVRVTPVVDGAVDTPICKTKIVVKAGEVRPTVLPTATSSAMATAAAVTMVQPKTGPSQWYWMSLGVLLVVWLGALKWYRTYLV